MCKEDNHELLKKKFLNSYSAGWISNPVTGTK